MIIDNSNGYQEIKADDGKALKIGNRTFKMGAFPLDFDVTTIEEIDEAIQQEDEEDE